VTEKYSVEKERQSKEEEKTIEEMKKEATKLPEEERIVDADIKAEEERLAEAERLMLKERLKKKSRLKMLKLNMRFKDKKKIERIDSKPRNFLILKIECTPVMERFEKEKLDRFAK